MLTIFALPKPFTDPLISTIQHNALRSWSLLRPAPEIILLGDDAGVADAARIFGARHIGEIAATPHGVPDVACIFRRASIAAQGRVMAYVNADIILMDNFTRAIERCAQRFDRFLMVGRRYDMDVTDRLEFANGWKKDLLSRRKTLHGEAGIDYFAHTRGLWSGIPPFSIGRASWDNWLVCAANRDAGTAVIDATDAVTIVHQNHNNQRHGAYTFEMRGPKTHPAVIENRRLAGDCRHTVKHAPWRMTRAGDFEQVYQRRRTPL